MTETEKSKHDGAVAYWDGVLDAQNLEREAEGSGLPLEDEIAFAASPEFICAAQWLERGGFKLEFIVDLGAGLGANAFALARRGHCVVAVDASAARLRSLMARARAAGCADKLRCVQAVAEHLPFAGGSVGGLFTKSVLIHTDLPRAAAEIARVLQLKGRAALVEPQPGNPFVNLYRNTLAPKAWQGITRYFGEGEQRIFAEAIEGKWDATLQVVPKFFWGFGAFVFQFAWARVGLFRAALSVTEPIDGLLFLLIPVLRPMAWFGVITLTKEPARHES